MAEVLLFHHAQGLTRGVLAFADDLRAAGHTVHTPDLYDGKTFEDLAAGIAHAESIGFETIVERGKAAAAALPASLVYAGFSLGVLPVSHQRHRDDFAQARLAASRVRRRSPWSSNGRSRMNARREGAWRRRRRPAAPSSSGREPMASMAGR